MRAIQPNDPLQVSAAQPERRQLSLEDLARDPRMENLRVEAPELHAEILRRVAATERPSQHAEGAPPPSPERPARSRAPTARMRTGTARLRGAAGTASEVPFSWEDVQARPRFGDLTAAERERVRQNYFAKYVAPTGRSREEFDQETRPGLLQRTGEAFAGSGQTMLGQAQQTIGYTLKQFGYDAAGEEWLASGRERLQRGAGEAIQLPYSEEGWEQLRNIPTWEFAQKMVAESAPQSVPYMVGSAGGGIGGAALGTMIAGPAGTVAGFIIGSFLASAGVVGAQRIGSAYDQYRQEHPDATDEEASAAALKDAGYNAGIEGLAAPLGVVGSKLTLVKQFATQAAIQSGHGIASQAAGNVRAGRPMSEGLATAGAGEIFLEAPTMVAATRHAFRPSHPAQAPGANLSPRNAEPAAVGATPPEGGAIPQGAPEARPGLPAPENLERGAQAIYQDLISQGVAPESAQAQVAERIRAYRQAREPRTVEVPAEEDLQPGEIVEVEEQPGQPPVTGIVAAVTPEGIAQVRVLNEDAQGQDFLAWARGGMEGEPPVQAEGPVPYPGRPAPPEQDAWRIVQRGTGRELGSALAREDAEALAQQFGDAEVLPPRGAPQAEQAQEGPQVVREQAPEPERQEARPAAEPPVSVAETAPQARALVGLRDRLREQVERARQPRTEPKLLPPLERAVEAEPARLEPRTEAGAARGDVGPSFADRLRLADTALRARARKLAGDADRGEDLLQDALLRMWEKQNTYQPGKPFMNWAQTVLRSVHANRARAFSRRPESALDFEADVEQRGVPPEQEEAFDRGRPAEEPAAEPPARPERKRGRIIKGATAPTESPAAEARSQDAARQPAEPERPETPPRSRIAQEVERARRKPPAPKMAMGREDAVSTEAGRQVQVRYAVVEAGDLITSHDAEGRANPDYPAELQPRQRERVASRQQIDELVSRLDPNRLRESAEASTGAPIIGPDGVVESGNGRTLAIRQAYRRGQADSYRNVLVGMAQRAGIDPREVNSRQQPVLVRVRQGEMTATERARFTREANAAPTAAMSPVEQAVADSRRADFTKLHVADDGSIDTPSNRDFIRLFLEDLPAAERGQLLDAQGNLNQLGRQRIRNAVFAAAYGDVEAVARMAESTDDNIRNITTGMLIAAPRFAQVRRQIAEGKLYPVDVTPFIVEAADSLSALRSDGVSLQDQLRNTDLLGPRYSTESVEIMQALDEMKRSGKQIGEFLTSIAQGIEDYGSPAQEGLFGARPTPSAKEAIALGRSRSAPRQGSLLPGRESAAAQDREEGPGSGPQPELSRAPLSDIVERRTAMERQLRLAALAGRDGDAKAPARAQAIRQQIAQVDAARGDAEQRAVRQVLSEVRHLYPSDPPMLRFARALESGAAGDYQAAKRLMRVSLTALDPLGTFDHEAMHDFRRWFLTPLENEALNAAFAPGSRAAREVTATLRSMGYNDAAAQAAVSTEERIAHAFSLRRTGAYKPRPAVRRVLDKIAQWMERVANLFRGRGFISAESIFTAIERGRVGARVRAPAGQAGMESGAQASMAPARASLLRRLAQAARVREPDAMTAADALKDAKMALTDALSEEEWRRNWARSYIRELLGNDGMSEALALGEPAQESRSPLTAETRSKARRIKVPPRTGETLGQRGAEALRGLTAPTEDILDYTVGVNTTRMNWATPDIDRVVAEYRRLFPENQRTQTWETTISAAERKLRSGEITEQTIIDWDERKLPNAIDAAAGDMLLSLRAEHLGKVSRQASRTGSKEDLARFQLFSAEFALMQGKVHGVRSETARALNIAKARPDLLRHRDRTINSILEAAGGQENLLRTAELIAALDDPAAIKQFMKQKWTPTWWDRVMEVWINGLLSNPATHAKNILGTRAFDDIVQNLDTLVAAGLGKLQGRTDRVYAGEVAAGLYAEMRALPEALALAKAAYLTEQSPFGRGKIEGVRQAISHPLGKHFFRQPGRALFGEDIFAKVLAYRKKLAQLAYRQASQEGVSSARKSARIEEILQNPPREIELAAFDYADYVTFTRKAGPMAQAVMKLVDSMDIMGAKPLKMILPFIRTPAQLLDVAIEHSPAAVFLKDFQTAWKEGGAARDIAVARMAVGSGALATAFLLAGAGMITGAGPGDPKEMEMWRNGGSPLRPGVKWQPNSLWTGDTYGYVSFAGLDPIALPLGLAATFVETGERASKDEQETIFGKLLGAFLKNVTSKTWLQGLSDAIEVANDPDRYGPQWVRRMGGSVVPAGVAQIARQVDPTLRETKTVMDAVRSRVPGWSKTLSPRINVKGEEIELGGALGPDIFSPFYQAGGGRTGPVARELTKLGVSIGPASERINGHRLTARQLEEYRKDAGARVWARLEHVVSAPGWAKLTPDRKEDRVRRAISFERKHAAMRLKQRYPELRKPARRLAEGA